MNDVMGAMGTVLARCPAILTGTGSKADVTMKLDKSTKPVEVILDCTEGISKVMDSGAMAAAGEDASVSVSKYVMTLTYKSFNAADEIAVPEEVKARLLPAAEMTALTTSWKAALPARTTLRNRPGVCGSALYPNADGTYTLESYWVRAPSISRSHRTESLFRQHLSVLYVSKNEDFDEISATYTLTSVTIPTMSWPNITWAMSPTTRRARITPISRYRKSRRSRWFKPRGKLYEDKLYLRRGGKLY